MPQSPKDEVSKITAWYCAAQRPLPWRKSHNPYAIWVSEIMLQQTQVVTAIPYFERFMERFPTPALLATATLPEVLVLWAGLGYYSRARNLHRGARYLMEKHEGVFPSERKAALEIPGVGPYTAGAVLSIAYDLPEAIVDGNVQRVFSRFFALNEPIESKQAQDFFWSKAALWVSAASSPRDFNQGLMELGATVCTKAQPNCGACPLGAFCEAKRTGEQARFPLRKTRRKADHLFWAPLVYQRKGKIFLRQNGAGVWWSGLWDFPRIEGKSAAGLLKGLKGAESFEALDTQKHTVTHHRIHAFPYVVRSKSKEKGEWVTPIEARKLPLSALAKKILLSYENHLSSE
jgi:A/G-specific adenine glycosylase